MKHRFRYIVEGVAPDRVVDLAPGDAHHLTRVVRRDVGDSVEILDEHGNVWDGVVEKTGPAVRVRVASAPRAAPRRPDVELAIGLADWGRMDLVVEKITEIGVRRMTVFRSERAGRVPDAAAFARRRERMSRVAEAAMRQSGHAVAPEIAGIADLGDVLAEWGEGTVLVDPRGTDTLGGVLRRRAGGPIRLVIGPDAGFSEDEVTRARAAGCDVARLGEGILRAETAAIAAAAISADALEWGTAPDAA